MMAETAARGTRFSERTEGAKVRILLNIPRLDGPTQKTEKRS